MIRILLPTMNLIEILDFLHGQMEEEEILQMELVVAIEEAPFYFGVVYVKDIEDMFKEILQVNMEINYG